MNRLLATAALLAAMSIAPAPAAASSAGGALYRPQPVAVHPQHSCSDRGCGPGSLCEACSALKCVDPALPHPCAADGTCYAKPSTFGYYQTKWRRWPTDVDSDQPTEAPEDEDSLLGPIDPPPATEEDQQAPPPIEDPSEDTEGEDYEIELPATPLPTEFPSPLPSIQPPAPEDAPPVLPFGAAKPQLPSQGPRHRLPAAQVVGLVNQPTGRVQTARFDGPPELPAGLAEAPAMGSLKRLPRVQAAPSHGNTILPASYRTVEPTQQLPK